MRPTPPAADRRRDRARRGLEGAKSRLGAVARRGGAPGARPRPARPDDPGRPRRSMRSPIGRRGQPGPDGPPAAARPGPTPIRQPDTGLNDGLLARGAWAAADGASAIVILPSTCRRSQPTRSAPSWRRGRRRAPRPAARGDRRRPPRAGHERAARAPGRRDPVRFGVGSRAAHRPPPRPPARRVVELDGPLAIDLDTARGPDPGRGARACSIRPVSADGGGRLEVVALDGIPEIRPGDDLPAIIGDALASDAEGSCRSAATTSSSSPRRSCRRPRARSST